MSSSNTMICSLTGQRFPPEVHRILFAVRAKLKFPSNLWICRRTLETHPSLGVALKEGSLPVSVFVKDVEHKYYNGSQFTQPLSVPLCPPTAAAALQVPSSTKRQDFLERQIQYWKKKATTSCLHGWEGTATYYTDGAARRGRAGFGVVIGAWGCSREWRRGYWARATGEQSSVRAELCGILWALQDARDRRAILVVDYDGASHVCAGALLSGSEDLCTAIHAEIRARYHDTIIVSVMSHPLEKGLPFNVAHYGNDAADKLAMAGVNCDEVATFRCAPPEQVVNSHGLPPPRLLFFLASTVCEPLESFKPTSRCPFAAKNYKMGKRFPRGRRAQVRHRLLYPTKWCAQCGMKGHTGPECTT